MLRCCTGCSRRVQGAVVTGGSERPFDTWRACGLKCRPVQGLGNRGVRDSGAGTGPSYSAPQRHGAEPVIRLPTR